MKLKWVWTVPNVLSLLRMVLVPVFTALYLQSDRHPPLLYGAVGVLVLSGLTDLFDGMIARRCNQMSEIGKLLDPAADKLTQVAVMLCLAIRLPRLWPLVAIGFIKELLQTIGAALLLFKQQTQVQSSRWYGKVSTFVFYTAMALFVVFPPEPHTPLLFRFNMPVWLFFLLAGLVASTMLAAFSQYTHLYVRLVKEAKASASAQTDAQEGAIS